jgi:hypothetical protein
MDDPYLRIQLAQAAITVLAALTLYWTSVPNAPASESTVSTEEQEKYKHL